MWERNLIEILDSLLLMLSLKLLASSRHTCQTHENYVHPKMYFWRLAIVITCVRGNWFAIAQPLLRHGSFGVLLNNRYDEARKLNFEFKPKSNTVNTKYCTYLIRYFLQIVFLFIPIRWDNMLNGSFIDLLFILEIICFFLIFFQVFIFVFSFIMLISRETSIVQVVWNEEDLNNEHPTECCLNWEAQ